MIVSSRRRMTDEHGSWKATLEMQGYTNKRSKAEQQHHVSNMSLSSLQSSQILSLCPSFEKLKSKGYETTSIISTIFLTYAKPKERCGHRVLQLERMHALVLLYNAKNPIPSHPIPSDLHYFRHRPSSGHIPPGSCETHVQKRTRGLIEAGQQ